MTKFISALLAGSLLATTALAQTNQIGKDQKQVKQDESKLGTDTQKFDAGLQPYRNDEKAAIEQRGKNQTANKKAAKAGQQETQNLNQYNSDANKLKSDQQQLKQDQTKFNTRTTIVAPVVAPQPVKH